MRTRWLRESTAGEPKMASFVLKIQDTGAVVVACSLTAYTHVFRAPKMTLPSKTTGEPRMEPTGITAPQTVEQTDGVPAQVVVAVSEMELTAKVHNGVSL